MAAVPAPPVGAQVLKQKLVLIQDVRCIAGLSGDTYILAVRVIAPMTALQPSSSSSNPN